MPKLNVEKSKLLDSMLLIYKQEVSAMYGINVVWKLLKNNAKDKCSEDFDNALIARESYIEELLNLKTSGIKVEQYEVALSDIDKDLLEMSGIAKNIFGLDVKIFLGAQKVLSTKK